jgi:hypothetical protein
MNRKGWIETAQFLEWRDNLTLKVVVELNGKSYLIYDGEKEGNPERDKRWLPKGEAYERKDITRNIAR